MFDLARARELMYENDLDVLIPFSPANGYYCSGTYVISHFLSGRLNLPIIPIDGPPILVTQINEAVQTRSESWIKDIRTYHKPPDVAQSDAISCLTDALTEKGLERSRIGIEMDHIVASHFERLRKSLPQATFKECKHVFEKMRMIKSSNEIEALRDAARATENSILAAFEAAHVGDTELSIAKNIGVNLAKEGSFVSFSPKFFISLGSGDRCYINHPQPTEKRVENGEAIRIDLGPMFNGYWADVSGYAHVGKPDETFRRDYEKLVKIYHNLFDFVRPGLAASEVYEHCKSLFTKHGLLWEDPQAPQFCVGHGIGLEIHEAPTLGPDDCNRLEENMVLSLEICGPWTQRQALAIEDLVLVTNSGAEWLSRIQDEPYLIK